MLHCLAILNGLLLRFGTLVLVGTSEARLMPCALVAIMLA
jgi:hypothetical protein